LSQANSFSLSQNYPNPFNPSTTIIYSLPTESEVKLKIVNLLGQEVAVLVNEPKHPGQYETKWDAGNLSSGVYFYVLEAESLEGNKSFRQVKKLLLLK